MKYLKTYADAGLLNTPLGKNAREECVKIKGVAKIARQVSGTWGWGFIGAATSDGPRVQDIGG